MQQNSIPSKFELKLLDQDAQKNSKGNSFTYSSSSLKTLELENKKHAE